MLHPARTGAGDAVARRRGRGRRDWWPLLKWVGLGAIFIAIGYAAHDAGTRLARIEVTRLEASRQEALAIQAALESDLRALATERDALRANLRILEGRLAREVPQGPLAELVAQLRARLAEPFPPPLLAEAIDRAAPVTRCAGPVVSRRFRIGIGPRGAEDDSTSFAEGMITVRAQAPATATDLTSGTTITFAGLGVAGGSRSVTGLPAETMLALGPAELRLVVGPSGVPGFVTASLTTCRPG